MARTAILAIAILIFGSWLTYQFPGTMISPGQLSTAHYRSSESCLDCHTLFQGASGSKCLSCHIQEKIGFFTTEGQAIVPGKKALQFHRFLDKNSCMSCHSEHEGRSAPKMIKRFRHSDLPESHIEDCSACHQKPSTPIHQNAINNCSQCHITDNWTPANFDHQNYFIFDRHHVGDCNSCHPSNSYDEYTCFSCHEHSERKLRQEHAEEGIRDITDCTMCHRSGNEDDAERIWKSIKRGTRIKQNDSDAEDRNKIKKRESRYYKRSDDDHDEHDDEDDD